MVLQMTVYDYNGRRVKVRKSEKRMDVPISDAKILPPIDNKQIWTRSSKPVNDNSADKGEDGSSNGLGEQQKVSLNSSFNETEMRIRASEDYAIQTLSSPNDNVKEKSGVLSKSLLSRRVNGQALYFPSLMEKPSSIRTSRSEPIPFDHFSRRYVYDRMYGTDSNDVRDLRQSVIRRRPHEERVVTFYRNFESTTPELSLVISENRFRDMRELIDDLSKILNLRDREKYIHTTNGKIITSLDEFTNGGVYFFGPPYVYNVGDYYKFRQAVTPELLGDEENAVVHQRSSRYSPTFEDYNKYGLTPYVGNAQKRSIRIITNIDSSRTYTMTVDTYRHRTLNRVMQELNDIIKLENGRVNYLCTRKGRMVHSIGDLFWTADDYFVGVVSSVTNQNPSRYHLLDEYNTSPNESPRKNGADIVDARDYKVVQVAVSGRVHTFDPPTPVHPDYPFLQNSDLHGNVDLRLAWVYGYNGKDNGNNVFILPTDEIVYTVSSAVVIYSHEDHRQRFYLEHTDEIRCIAQHPGNVIFASGQRSGGDERDFSHIRVWDSKSLLTHRVLDFDRLAISVECLAFSKVDDGIHLASVYSDGADWRVAVWDWSIGAMSHKSGPHKSEEVACAFHPEENMVITCGSSHVYRWRLTKTVLEREAGHFYDYKVPELVTCIAFTPENQLITGDSEGFVHIWDDENFIVSSVIKTKHNDAIASLTAFPTGHVMTGGSSDRLVTVFNPAYAMPTITLAQLPEEFGGVAAIAIRRSAYLSSRLDDLPLLIGTTKNYLVSGSIKASFTKVVSGSAGLAKALAVHPSEPAFLCAGNNKTVEMWSGQTHTEVWSTPVDHDCTSAAFHPSGEVAVIGTTKGSLFTVSVKDSSHISSFQCDEQSISAIQFSVDSNMLAAGSSNGTIFLFLVYDQGRSLRFLETIKTSLNSIIAIDWSITSHHFRFVTSALEMGVWNIARKSEEVRRHVKRDIVWTSHNSVLSYQTSGIWSSCDVDGNFTTASRSNSGELFCVAGSRGVVRLFAYPCDLEGAFYQSVSLHKCPVSHVRFLSNDHSVVSLGESDSCLAQWSISLASVEQGSSPRVGRRRLTHYIDKKKLDEVTSSTGKYRRQSVVNNSKIIPTGAEQIARGSELQRPRRMSITDNARVSKREHPFGHDYIVRDEPGMSAQAVAQAWTTDYVMNSRPYMVTKREVEPRKRLSRLNLAASMPDLQNS